MQSLVNEHNVYHCTRSTAKEGAEGACGIHLRAIALTDCLTVGSVPNRIISKLCQFDWLLKMKNQLIDVGPILPLVQRPPVHHFPLISALVVIYLTPQTP